MKCEYLECGKVCNAHGVHGLIKVESWCDSPKVLAAEKRIFIAQKDGDYREYKILSASVSGSYVLMNVEGIDSREAAIAFKNTIIYLHRSDIPVKKGQMLIADMIGLPVIDADSGIVYGKIKAVDEGVRGFLYTVDTEKGDVLYPSAPQLIKEIVPEKGMMITPISGFFD